MSFDDLVPRLSSRGAALADAGREDLDLYSVEELEERIATLEAEIGRTRRALDSKCNRKSAAESLFSFKSG